MARIRTVKPEFFRHLGLYEAEQDSGLPLRLAFEGLWVVADRAGRFRWRPPVLKLDILPFDNIDFSRVLDALATRGFVVRYEVGGQAYGYIPSWGRHQVINNREAGSELPQPPDPHTEPDASSTRAPPVTDLPVHAQGEGEGEGEGKGREGNSSEAKASGASAPSAEKELFDRGKRVLGKQSGGLLANLLKAKDGSVELARAALEIASTKSNPREYLGAIIRGRDPPPSEQRWDPRL